MNKIWTSLFSELGWKLSFWYHQVLFLPSNTMIRSLPSEHVTSSLLKGRRKASFFGCFDAAMGSRLLCCVALCLLGAGESWAQKKNPVLGWPTPLSRSIMDFVYSFCFLLLQALVMPKSFRLPHIWSKAEDRKQRWIVSLIKDIP